MSGSMLIFGFLFLVFAPCLVALLAGSFADGTYANGIYLESWHIPRHRGSRPVALSATFPEGCPAEDFEIRSFPKGISQRRLLVRDTESGVKLTISQVREAAVELIKLGGMAAAHEFALVAAASAVAMHSVKNSFALAAREVMEAAHNAFQWFAWGEMMAEESSGASRVWEEAPPRLAPLSVGGERWHEASQAA
jgi:hypothetical protein